MPIAIMDHLQQKGTQSPHKLVQLECPAQKIRKAVSLGPRGHLLHKATPPSLGDMQLYVLHINKYREAVK